MLQFYHSGTTTCFDCDTLLDVHAGWSLPVGIVVLAGRTEGRNHA